ncbi:FAD-dependent oxidoreductase [Hyphomonas sp.]|uniref:FAD-dependent oxidoreductase n=1 Tax=Hyphomonas sp. TaxID=87 RepID=UPI0032426F56
MGALTARDRHVLLAGGGHAHAVALRRLAKKPLAPDVRLTLVAPSTQNLYSGALPGVIAGHWTADAIGVPLEPLCAAAGISFVQDSITSIDAGANTVQLASGNTLSFDLASLDVGSGIRPLEIAGSRNGLVPIRPISPFLLKWQDAIDSIRGSDTPPSIVVIGAGLAGIEVVLAIKFRLTQLGVPDAKVHLVDAGNEIASGNSLALRRKLHRALDRANITLWLNARVRSVDAGIVCLSTGETLEAALAVNCAGSAPHDWIGESALSTVQGRVEVDPCLRSTSHTNIWAAGDTSYFKASPLEPAGVFAVRAGPVIAENIQRWSQDQPLTHFNPQSDYLKLVSLGEQKAVAEKFGITLEGGWVWKLKKWIDFSFLRQHSLPARD